MRIPWTTKPIYSQAFLGAVLRQVIAHDNPPNGVSVALASAVFVALPKPAATERVELRFAGLNEPHWDAAKNLDWSNSDSIAPAVFEGTAEAERDLDPRLVWMGKSKAATSSSMAKSEISRCSNPSLPAKHAPTFGGRFLVDDSSNHQLAGAGFPVAVYDARQNPLIVEESLPTTSTSSPAVCAAITNERACRSRATKSVEPLLNFAQPEGKETPFKVVNQKIGGAH